MSDTTSPESVEPTGTEFDQSTDKAMDFMQPAVVAAREAGVPEVFDDNTAVFIHRTGAGGGYVLVAFDPTVLVRWANSRKGFNLLRGGINFLPMGMPVLSVELEDIENADGNGEEQGSDQQEHQDDEA